MQLKSQRIFRDKDDHIVIWQKPNALLSGWVVIKVAALFLHAGHLKSNLEQLATLVLFAWALYEAAKGVNYFRKALGVVVLGIIILNIFR